MEELNRDLQYQNLQYQKWNSIYADHKYFYGQEPGPVARRAVRYHRPLCPSGGTALDVGCGEGQDLAFLAECGYQATGVDFTEHGVAKTRRLLEQRHLQAQVLQCDARQHDFVHQYNLVIAVNSLQFMGAAAGDCLARVMDAVAPGGIIGLSLFARDENIMPLRDDIFYLTLPELMARFQNGGSASDSGAPSDGDAASENAGSGHSKIWSSKTWQMLEAAQLWQWSHAAEEPQAFVTLIAQRLPPRGS